MKTRPRRDYAAFWEWPNKETKEAGIMNAFLNARDSLGCEQFETVDAGADPPDFVARRDGRVVAVELTELVSEKAVRHNIGADFVNSVYMDWTPEAALAAIQERITDKDGKLYFGGPFDEIQVVIHTDEPTLSHDDLSRWLKEHRFAHPRQICRAYLLLSYDPTFGESGGYPLIEIPFDDAGPA